MAKRTRILSSYCDEEILKSSNHFQALLQLNQCVITSIPNEWDVLKGYVLQMLIVLIQLIIYKHGRNFTPFSKATLERMFS